MDSVRLNVTELCCACSDPKWRADWLAGRATVTRPHGAPGTVVVYGTQFHGFARKLVTKLVHDDGAPANATDSGLLKALLATGAGTFIDGLLEKEEIESAGAFSDALHNFSQRLVQLSARAPQARRWSDIFQSAEQTVQNALISTTAGPARLSGKVDCVRIHPTGQFEVVDYKLGHGAELQKEMIQVAIYRSMITTRDSGIECRGALEYYLPQLQVQELDAATLDDVFRTLVLPVLEEIVAYAGRKHAPAPPPPRPVAQPARMTPEQSANGMSRALEAKPQPVFSPVRPAPKPLVFAPPQPMLDSSDELTLGQTRGVKPERVAVSAQELLRHSAFLGGSGSGKTTFALNIIEQLLRVGIPALLIDRKGDLCRYGELAYTTSAQLPGDVEQRVALGNLFNQLDIAVFTPGHPDGRALAIGLLPAGLESLEGFERDEACRAGAEALGKMLSLKAGATDQAKLAILVQALVVLTELREAAPIGIDQLISLVDEADPSLLERLGPIDAKHCKPLAQQLQTLKIMRGSLFSPKSERLTAELLFGLGSHAQSGKTRLSIVSTKFLGDDAAVLFWVSQLLIELGRHVSRSPSSTLQGVVMFDEADMYLPAASKPPTKGPMENLLKRARSGGLGVMLATQSPGDLDYRCRENVRTWCIGLVKEPRALEKLAPLLSDASMDAAAVLPKQRVGQFFVLSEGKAQPVQADRNLVETHQLPESEILLVAKASRTST